MITCLMVSYNSVTSLMDGLNENHTQVVRIDVGEKEKRQECD